MTILEEVKSKLVTHPEFRERKTRAIYLAILSLRATGLEKKYKETPLTREELADFGVTFDSYRRAWVEVLRKNPELQGTDYGDKQILVDKKLTELGYYNETH